MARSLLAFVDIEPKTRFSAALYRSTSAQLRLSDSDQRGFVRVETSAGKAAKGGLSNK